MDPNILKQLGLNSNISPNDAKILQQLLSQMADKNGRVKMTPQERNQLMARLSNQSNEYVATKDVSEMSEEERKVHREQLRKKLRNRLNGMEQMRAGPSAAGGKKNLNSALSNINQMMSGLNTSGSNPNPNMDNNGMGQDISHLLSGLGNNQDISKLLSNIDMKELSKHATSIAENSVKSKQTNGQSNSNETNETTNKPVEKDESLDDYLS